MVLFESAIVPALKAAAGLGAAAPAGVVALMRRVNGSVGIAAPTAAMLAEENPSDCALFRHLPGAADRLAWRSLGARRTPIHYCETPGAGGGSSPRVSFLVKREDLLSPLYGGNKVRTLQHQLAVCEARRDKGEAAFRQLVSVGTGGSNQVVATVVHASKLGWDGVRESSSEEGDDGGACNNVNACWFDKDEPDFDNTLNMLSVLSFPNVGWTYNWGDSVGPRRFLGSISGAWTQKGFVPMMPGGNCPAGVLGQVGGLLELVEQIISGECEDPGRIYLPIGSACTISGLIVGTVLARRLGLPALSRPDFQIVGCNVHDGLAMLDAKIGFHSSPFFRFIPLTITHTVRSACAALREIGGPDIEKDALDFIKTSVSIRSDPDIVGVYGAHSDETRASAIAYDEYGTVRDGAGTEAKPLWVCGHFVGKAFEPLVHDLENKRKENGESDADCSRAPYLLWMTKSSVQPRGNLDEWKALLQENDTVRKWADEGRAESALRPGRVSTIDGSADDYRQVMTKLQ